MEALVCPLNVVLHDECKESSDQHCTQLYLLQVSSSSKHHIRFGRGLVYTFFFISIKELHCTVVTLLNACFTYLFILSINYSKYSKTLTHTLKHMLFCTHPQKTLKAEQFGSLCVCFFLLFFGGGQPLRSA